MEFKCQNGKSIIYNVVKPNIYDALTDFFLQDVKEIINHGEFNIDNIYYIINIEMPDPIKMKNEYVKMLKEFIDSNTDKFIIFRLGYDSSQPKDELEVQMLNLIESYTAARECGFVDISSISGLEFSKCMLYNNTSAKQFLEVVSRYEIMAFVKNDFTYKDIFNDIKVNE